MHSCRWRGSHPKNPTAQFVCPCYLSLRKEKPLEILTSREPAPFTTLHRLSSTTGGGDTGANCQLALLTTISRHSSLLASTLLEEQQLYFFLLENYLLSDERHDEHVRRVASVFVVPQTDVSSFSDPGPSSTLPCPPTLGRRWLEDWPPPHSGMRSSCHRSNPRITCRGHIGAHRHRDN